MSLTSLTAKYAFFSALAMAANIGSQELMVRTYIGAFDIMASVSVGTGVGLVVKYLLDKRYIFRFQTTGFGHDAKTFTLYAFMGLITTVIFWGFEFGFHQIFETKAMRYFGGVIGLAIGYLTKYQIDKRYVFTLKK